MFGFSVPAGAFLVATATGLASIVVFQKIACTYLKQAQALQATLAYFLFPPIFVFSAVSYSEPVFLFFSLLAWYYHIKKKDWQSCVAATLSTLARPIGVFIIIPLGYQYLRTRQYGKLAYCTVPVITVTGWITYSFFMTGTLAALKANGIYWRTEYFALVEETIRESLQGHAGVAVSKLLEYAHEHVITLVVSLASLVIVAALARRVMKIDRALGVYTIMLVGGILCVLPTSFGSFPRYLAFIFPIGLALHTKKMKVAIFLLIILALLDYLAWYAFLTYSFASV
jgi:hypothetical protein